MNKPSVALSLSVGILILSGWGIQVVRAADCGEPVPAPKYQVGEKWTWRDEKGNERTREVVGFEGDLAAIKWSNPRSQPDREGTLFFDSDWVIRKALRPDGSVITQQGAGIYTTVGQRLLDFPLQVGKTWERSYLAQPRTGTLQPYLHRYRVISCEEIAVPAGKFSALKVELENHNIRSGRSGVVYNWFSPEAKNYIKSQIVPSRYWGGDVLDYELIKFESK